jgi:hypothetical protein
MTKFLMEECVIRPQFMERGYIYMEVILSFFLNINLGMKNPDTTLDNLSILCLDGKVEDLEEGNLIIPKYELLMSNFYLFLIIMI